MTLNYYEAESTISPDTIDETSSKKYTYIHKNIEEYTKTTDDDSSITMYKYQEAKVSKEDYELYKSEILKDIKISELEEQIATMSANLDYLLIMQDMSEDDDTTE